MCTTCGCSDGATTTVDGKPFDEHSHHHHSHDHTHHGEHHHHDHHHGHSHDHHHHHGHLDHDTETVALERRILEKNDQLAQYNRGWLSGRGVLSINLLSSPGAGKTTLLESSIRTLSAQLSINVVEGDQATENDAERIRRAGAKAVQINTGTGCHLEADMLARGLETLNPEAGSLLFIENVGNLVCPALFDLGEHRRVVILSVTEGDDKPLKYPHMFAGADLLLLNKIDLLPYVSFDVDACIRAAREVNPDIETLCVSATTGEGLASWHQWLHQAMTSLHTGNSPAGDRAAGRLA